MPTRASSNISRKYLPTKPTFRTGGSVLGLRRPPATTITRAHPRVRMSPKRGHLRRDVSCAVAKELRSFGKYWFGIYDRPEGPFPEYRSLTILMESLLRMGTLATPAHKAFVTEALNQAKLPEELLEVFSHLVERAPLRDLVDEAEARSNPHLILKNQSFERYSWPESKLLRDQPNMIWRINGPSKNKNIGDYLASGNRVEMLKRLGSFAHHGEWDLQNHIKKYLANPISSANFGEEELPWLLGVAEAVRVSPESLEVSLKDGRVMSLPEWIKEKSLSMRLKTPEALKTLVTSSDHPQKLKKLADMLRAESEFSLPMPWAEVIDALIDIKDEIKPIQLVGDYDLEAWTKIFRFSPYPEINALLMGMLFKVEEGPVERYLKLPERPLSELLAKTLESVDGVTLRERYQSFAPSFRLEDFETMTIHLILDSGSLEHLDRLWQLYGQESFWQEGVLRNRFISKVDLWQREDPTGKRLQDILSYFDLARSNGPHSRHAEDCRNHLAGLDTERSGELEVAPSATFEEALASGDINAATEAADSLSRFILAKGDYGPEVLRNLVEKFSKPSDHHEKAGIPASWMSETVQERELKKAHSLGISEPRTILVEGIPLLAHDLKNKDHGSIPSDDHTPMVFSPTIRRALKMVAMQWSANKATILEGPSGVGKTSLIRELCRMTGTPFTRINMTPKTDVEDLVGRMVGGDIVYTAKELQNKSTEELLHLAHEYGAIPNPIKEKPNSTEDERRRELVELVYEAQKEPHWQDGPVSKALMEGHCLVVDEANLARPEVLESLNRVLDDNHELVQEANGHKLIKAHPLFRVFATENPASYGGGRQELSHAAESRWTRLEVPAYNQKDYQQILTTLYPDILPKREMAKLITSHMHFEGLADQNKIGRGTSGVVYSLRELFRVIEQFKFFKDRNSPLSDEDLLYREFTEVYLGGLQEPKELLLAENLLTTTMPYSGGDLYGELPYEVTIDDRGRVTSFSIGDIKVDVDASYHHDLIPDISKLQVIPTARLRKTLYKVIKSLELGQAVILVGERASGKSMLTKFVSALYGLPHYQHNYSEKTDLMELIGSYDTRGFQPSQFLEAVGIGGEPGLYVPDEINLVPDIQERLNVLDGEGAILLPERGGQRVEFHEKFKFLGTMNPVKRGYAGRHKLSRAFRSRVSEYYVDNLDQPDELKEISSQRGGMKDVSDDLTDALVDLQEWILNEIKDENLAKGERIKFEFSIRQINNVIDHVLHFTGHNESLKESLLQGVENNYAAKFPNLDDQKKIMAKAEEMFQ